MEEEIAALAARIDELRRRQCSRSIVEGAVRERIALEGQLHAAQDKLASIFADQHGWKRANRPFSVKCLAVRGMHGHGFPFCTSDMDHPDYFRQNRRAAAIVSHLYDIPDNAEAWAQEHGLKMTVSDFPSWYWPKACKLVIYTPALPVNPLGKGVSRARERALTIG